MRRCRIWRRSAASDTLAGPPGADFAFVDLASGERWTLAHQCGPAARGGSSTARGACRAPARATIWRSARLLWASADRPSARSSIARVRSMSGWRGHCFWRRSTPSRRKAAPPLPARSCARRLAAGGKACRPLIAREGLGPRAHRAGAALPGQAQCPVQFGRRLRALDFAGRQVAALDFGDDKVVLDAADAVILAVPPVVAADVVPEPAACRPNSAPSSTPISASSRRAELAPIIGVVNGTVEWLFAFPGRLSVTISAADRLLDVPREALAKTIWREVAAGRRASQGAAAVADRARTPRHFRRDAGAECQAPRRRHRLAQPGARRRLDRDELPATIEGAIRSGNRAADLRVGSMS